MSRIELDAIQDKLKAAIQNHQMLVKTKGDKQNVAFKSCLTDLQEEIKRLSEEQKKIVVKLREGLVRSSSQSVAPQSSLMSQVLTLNQSGAAVGQSTRLVPYASQGGRILPVGMVAVPVAHVQRPGLGLTFNPGRGGSQIVTPAANITLQARDYATAVAAAAQLPSGIHGNSISIPINSINNSNNIALQNSIAINNITNAINVSNLNGGITLNGSSINVSGLTSNPNLSNLTTIIGSGGITTQPVGNIVLGSHGLTQLNSHNNSQNNNNITTTTTAISSLQLAVNVSQITQNIKQPISTLLTSANSGITSVNIVPSNGLCIEADSTTLSSVTSSSVATVAQMSKPPTITTLSTGHQAPVIRPQAPQQQQQKEVVQLNQPAAPGQAALPNFPIKVPQYTASPIRTSVSSTVSQLYSAAPAPRLGLPTPSVRLSVTSASSTSSSKKQEAVKTVTVIDTKPVHSKPSLAESSSTQSKKQPRQSPSKSLSSETLKKQEFMRALDLFAPDMLKDLLHKRNERKRRTTANPHYSIGFESHRWNRMDSVPGVHQGKKARVTKERKPAGSKANQQENNIDKKDKISDNHDDFCAACGKGGQLLMCETCRLVYHLDCLRPPLTEAPKYAWSCPKCLVSGKGSANLSSEALSRVHAYIGKRIAKEDERRKLQKKGGEIRNEKSFLDSRSKKLDTEMKDQHEAKKKLDRKDQVSCSKLNRLSAMVQSVRRQHQSSASAAAAPAEVSVSSSRTSTPPSMPAVSVSANTSSPGHVVSNTDPINESESGSNSGNDNTDTTTLVSSEAVGQGQVDTAAKDGPSILGEDRILMEFHISTKEICDAELSKSLQQQQQQLQLQQDVEVMKVKSSSVDNDEDEDMPLTSNVIAGSESEPASESLLNEVVVGSSSGSETSAVSSSSSFIVSTCGELWKQPVVAADKQLSVSL